MTIIRRLLGKVTAFSKITNTRVSGRRSKGKWLMALAALFSFRNAMLSSSFFRTVRLKNSHIMRFHNATDSLFLSYKPVTPYV